MAVQDFVNIILSKTQRKTPTVIHKQFDIGRIRRFYMRKVKYTQTNFHEKIKTILDEFPKLESIHPFFADLINMLYEAEHFTLALKQLKRAMDYIDKVGDEYVKMLKYGDSLYRCKQLKRAALGRMATVIKKQKDSLQYLEEVRQHLSRLPSIDPEAPSLLLCGFPNVGKSSFLNTITKADVDVQPYAFTTKSLYVGHTNYNYLKFQVIDTPGLLDHALDERNNIEMLAITALTYINAAIVYVVDVSEECSETLESQYQLFNTIRPIFSSRPVVVALNKIDVQPVDSLSPEKKAILEKFSEGGVQLVPMCAKEGDSGCSEVRNVACDKILDISVERKLKERKMGDIMSNITIVQPEIRDNKARPPCIPTKVLEKKMKKMEVDDGGEKKKLVSCLEMCAENYDLPEEQKYDIRPEIMDGKNVADFLHPDIREKLEELLKEQEMLEQAGMFDPPEPETDEDRLVRELMEKLRQHKALLKAESHVDNTTKSKMPRQSRKAMKIMAGRSRRLLLLMSINNRANNVIGVQAHYRVASRSQSKAPVLKKARLDVSTNRVRSNSRMTPRDQSGMRDPSMQAKVKHIAKKSQTKMNRDARKGEADRKILNMRPKHLLSGKRGIGKTQRR
ncbi:GTPBP4 [Cordylochernes scorpioides]|uniref:Nucleolar GTP-binding protein 1 n=1 Tax=Cordylochernes scorpioides TaxID=51811 RepID=A0ABY6K4E0_9ARAC|nr:GTPBP4 [Cordylochernes scorpioides]